MKTKGMKTRNTFRGVKKEQLQHEVNMCIASMTVSLAWFEKFYVTMKNKTR